MERHPLNFSCVFSFLENNAGETESWVCFQKEVLSVCSFTAMEDAQRLFYESYCRITRSLSEQTVGVVPKHTVHLKFVLFPESELSF